jgi:hypothetical protein
LIVLHSSAAGEYADTRTDIISKRLQTDSKLKSRCRLLLQGDQMHTKRKENQGDQMLTKRKENRCKGRTKAGKPCDAAATEGGLCFFHANPNKASELGRIGGRSNRHAVAENGDPLPPLDNAVAVRDAAGRLIADVIAGKIHPRVAAGLAPLINLQLHAITIADLEQRLAKLVQQSKLRDGTSHEPSVASDQSSGY